MDAIISSALEEICSQGRGGLAISSLCSKLALSVELKRALWTNLLKIPAVQFQLSNRVYDPNDPSIQCFEDAEKLDLIVVAKEKLRDNFLGIYDFSLGANEKEFLEQRLLLERIASARTNGITQSQLSKEFGIEGSKIFYRVKKLEKSGLIVRQDAVDRTRGAGKQGQSTMLIHLYRYAKHLGSQEKFEITKEEDTADDEDSSKEHIKEDVVVKDYVPSMKAICDKLEEANAKVLVISDIKHDLGYVGSRSKHRYWENICGRLKNAGVVEEIYVKVNGKEERCLRLLKKFSRMDLEQKTIRYVEGKELKLGRSQIANQLVELPIEHQIYDSIDAAGLEGKLITEVSKRLGIEVGKRFGIDKKTNNKNSIISIKYGMLMQKELHNRTLEYRIWAARNCKSSNVVPSRSKDLSSKKSSLAVVNPRFSNGSSQISHLLNYENDTLWKTNNSENEIELFSCSPLDSEASNSISNTGTSEELIHETKAEFSNTAVHLVKSATMTLKPCQSLTVDGTRREQRILEWLQVEKIVLRAELYRWLVNLEKDKGTTMDRRTVDRILYKLESQGQCKCIHLALHEIMNTNVNRKVKVVLHPSIQSFSSEVLGRIRDRLVSFDKQTHGQASFKKKNISPVLVLDCVQRTHTQDGSNSLALRMESMRANGFILGKMVRAKLLHSFLWDYACSSSARDDVLSNGRQDHDLQNPYVNHNLFDVEAAIKGIPLELFLQVVGSTVKVDNMIEKFKKGVCLCDLSIQEYNELNDSSAIRRLSSILSILQRLKLIRLVTSGSSDEVVVAHKSPVYALELKPYIEEPRLIATYSDSGSLDLCPDTDVVYETIRHDFILSNRNATDEYWQVLEYSFALADPKAALNAFPGSILHEVLRVYYAKLRPRNKFQDNLKAVGAECQSMCSSFSKKRRRSAESIALKHKKVDNKIGPFCQHNLSRSADSDKDFMEEENLMLASPREHETQLQEHQEEDHWKTSEKPRVNRDKHHSSTSHSAFSNRQVGILEAPRKPESICDSQFPSHAGSRAAKFSRWLRECEKDFMKGGIDLTVDLQCGEIFHLFALVSSGELFISPYVPFEGVGEAEYIRSLKQTSIFNDSIDGRREKGFPGIKLSVHRAPMPRAVSLESSFKNGEKCGNEHFVDRSYQGSNTSHSEIIKENLNCMQGDAVLPGANNGHDLQEGCKCYDADSITKKNKHRRIISQAFHIVMQNPGILEDDIVRKMDLSNPQHCKKLLRLMVRDKYLIVKKKCQNKPRKVPALLGTLIGGKSLEKSELIYREHFFANTMRTSLL
ncbi:hypothetical protein REPUB_Repub13aG0190500 [Reevesia pubescens]